MCLFSKEEMLVRVSTDGQKGRDGTSYFHNSLIPKNKN
jgi:hypothetical protein